MSRAGEGAGAMSVGVLGFVEEAHHGGEEVASLTRSFGLDGLQSSARLEFKIKIEVVVVSLPLSFGSGCSVPGGDEGGEDGLNDDGVEVHHHCHQNVSQRSVNRTETVPRNKPLH